MSTTLLLLSVSFAYFSYMLFEVVKQQIEEKQNIFLKHGQPYLGPKFNNDSIWVALPLVTVYIMPTLSLYFLFGSDKLWMLIVYLFLNMFIYKILGTSVNNLFLKSFVNNSILTFKRYKSERLIAFLSLMSILCFIIFFILN
jgi:hypothetical protein